LEAVEFLKCCLELDPAKRITAAEALQHPFLINCGPVADEDLNDDDEGDDSGVD
jgi:cell division control protein 7